MRVDERLLVDPPAAFDRSNVKSVLRAEITGMFCRNLPVDFLLKLGFLERHNLSFGEHEAILRTLGL